MNYKILSLIAFMALAVPTLAQAQVVDATAVSGSTSVSESGAVAGAMNAGNAQSITFGGQQERLQAPSTALVQAMPTAPCVVTGGLSLSVPGGSASAGGGRINQQCMLYERSRVIAQGLGDVAWAVQLLRGGDPEAERAYQRAHPVQGPTQ